MSTTDEIDQKGTVGEPAFECFDDEAIIDEVDERERWLAPSVEQETRAKIDDADDLAHEDRLFGQTLEAEERLAAYEWELERTRVRFDRRQDSDREARTRQVVEEVNRERRFAFAKRAASVDPWADPEKVDAREQLSREELGVVNRESARVARRLPNWSRAAVSRILAERVIDGQDVMDAVLSVSEELRVAPGQVIPIAMVGEVGRREVDVEGRVNQLWEPSHQSIQQVGLLTDETGSIKFTVWRKSRQPRVREGQQVRFRNVSKSWWRGQVSVALTGWSRIVYP